VTLERTATAPTTTGRTAAIRIAALLAIVAVAAFAAYRFGWLDYRHAFQRIEAIRETQNAMTFAILFVGIYALFTALGGPATPFTVVSGALFGLVPGSIVAWIGAMVGAAAGYWLARTVGRGAVSRSIEKRQRVRAALEKTHDFHGMLGLRLVPILPIGIVSFVGGLAKAPFMAYLAATAVGVIPTTIIFCYFADSLVASGSGSHSNPTRAVLIASALVAALMLAPKMLRSRSS
jgi:uncharacterized membrane protein YdjX (TVP38/TMEM64 family)